MSLTDKHCVPCEGGTPPLQREEVARLHKDVPLWNVVDDTRIVREFVYKNFGAAMTFVNRVADLAETEGHHPNIYLHSWNKVRLELETHAVGGLSENDFILAAKIEHLV